MNPPHAPDDDWLACELRRFGSIGILSMVVILLAGTAKVGDLPAVPIGALLVLAWASRSHTPWQAIGYVRPTSWFGDLAGAIALGIGLKLLMKAVVMPLLGADPVNHSYHFLAGNQALLPAAIWAMLVAGFAEETVFRGYLFERGAALLGRGTNARVAIILVTSALFGLAHIGDQGFAGAAQGTLTGLIFGAIFSITGRIFFLMWAHAAFDLTALAMIYWNFESKVGHSLFR